MINVHHRTLDTVTPAQAGALLDTLASDNDLLWPHQSWPPMKLHEPLGVGAIGGHGPVRYVVEAYTPGASVRFRFLAPRGFVGFHTYEVAQDSGAVILRHVLEMRAQGPALVTWPLFFRPLHDALIEDSLARAEAVLGLPAKVQPWSVWVRMLRWIASRGRARSKVTPERSEASTHSSR